jgi:CubicO group peptidase (beta-lactamase class C family)
MTSSRRRQARHASGTALVIWGLLPALLAAQEPPTPRQFAEVRTYLEQAVDRGAFPGAVIVVGLRGRVVYHTAVGVYGEDDRHPVTDTTVYDLASLTKVVGLTTAVMLLVSEGRLDLDASVQHYLPEFTGAGKDRVTVRHLLLHSSGLPAWRPLYQEAADPSAARALADTTPLEAPAGTRYTYSDLGAIVLTQIVERLTGKRLDSLLAERVFAPLGMTRTRFLPPAGWLPFIAPTERDPWRGRVLRGEVHDENAARLGGVSGHAGLFSNGPDLARFTFWLLDAYHDRLPPDAGLRLPAPLVRSFLHRANEPTGSTRALGWDTPSPEGGSGGHCLSPTSFGHTGFTGTSIWIDPERDIVIILLTNRVHPTRENQLIREVRPGVADRVVRALAGAAACPLTDR